MYQVIITGTTLPGFDVCKVKEDVQHLLKLNPEQIQHIFSQNNIIIANHVDEEKGTKIQLSLQTIGLECLLQPNIPKNTRLPSLIKPTPINHSSFVEAEPDDQKITIYKQHIKYNRQKCLLTQNRYDRLTFANVSILISLFHMIVLCLLVHSVDGIFHYFFFWIHQDVDSILSKAPFLWAIIRSLQIYMTSKRLHDINVSGWLSFLVIPLGFLIIPLLCFIPGINNENQYGPIPEKGNVIVVYVLSIIYLLSFLVPLFILLRLVLIQI